MAGEMRLRESVQADSTGAWLLNITPDFAPEGFQERVRQGESYREWSPSLQVANWSAGHHCCHRDSNFWFWMWAFSSHRTEVHHHHSADYGSGAVPPRGAWASRREEDSSRAPREGMSSGQRVAAGAAGTIIAAAAKEGFDYFQGEEAQLRQPLGKTRQLKRHWEQAIVTPQDRAMHQRLLNVLKAQEKVESTRVNRLSIYKWSSVVFGIGGVALVVGALINLPELVIAGLVAATVALTFAGMTWIISYFKDDTAPAKKAYEDYRQVATHFLVRDIPEDPPAYSRLAACAGAPPAYTEESVDQPRFETASWVQRADQLVDLSRQEWFPSFEDIEVRMQALAARDLQKAQEIENVPPVERGIPA